MLAEQRAGYWKSSPRSVFVLIRQRFFLCHTRKWVIWFNPKSNPLFYIVEQNSHQDSNSGKVGMGQWYLEGSLVHFPCVACEKGEHWRCIEENLRLDGFITGSKAHCNCLKNDHFGNHLKVEDFLWSIFEGL